MVTKVVLVYYILINVSAFAAMAYDKRCAVRQKWRVPERTLLLLAGLGGAPGSFLSMRLAHHKTRHKKFTILVPLFLLLHVALLIYLFAGGLL